MERPDVVLSEFKSRLACISTDAPIITGLSEFMRGAIDPVIRRAMLEIWLADVDTAADASQLLALVYLANDVIQLLRSTRELAYRYDFAAPFALAIVAIRNKAPHLVPKIQRILYIFKERVIYDSQIMRLLQRALEEPEISVVLTSIVPTLQSETSLPERLQQLDKETRAKSIIPPIHQQQVRHPPLDLILNAGRKIERLCCHLRRKECVNLDASSVPHFRGHRVLPNARISPGDSQWIESYKLLLDDHKTRVEDIREKAARRKKEEEKGRYYLMGNASSAVKRVEVLMRKELNTRVQKLETENALYWKLAEMLEHLGNRWKLIQSIVNHCSDADRLADEGRHSSSS